MFLNNYCMDKKTFPDHSGARLTAAQSADEISGKGNFGLYVYPCLNRSSRNKRWQEGNKTQVKKN